VDRVVIHITAGGPKIEGTIAWFQNPDRVNERTGKPIRSSAHYIVGREGQVVQMVRNEHTAHHASGSNWRSIGIEHNANKPTRSNPRDLPPTEPQYESSARLVAWLCGQLGIPADREHIVGHAEISPRDNHDCPSSIWDWDHYMDLVQSAASAGESQAQAFGLPGRTWPRTQDAPQEALKDEIIRIAGSSDIARYSWQNRGVAPAGYIKGMALVYARVYSKFKAGEAAAVEMAKAKTADLQRDALAWYDDVFAAAGMSNDTDGVDTLRHLFVLLIGLGMRESSGKYCTGRDMSAQNTTAETAEAGLFQTSFNARHASPLLPALFADYSANPSGFLDVFKEGVRCSVSDQLNFGSGDGMEFQRLSKECPAFAAEFAAVGLRNIRRHWGPINQKTAEVRPECDALLRQVEVCVDTASLPGTLSTRVSGARAQAMRTGPQAAYARAQEIITPFYDPADPASALTCQNDAFSLAREEWFVGVPNTRIFPHSAICQLLMTGPDGSTYMGTGFYIGSNRILTCAHNLSGMSSVTIIPGRNGSGDAPFGKQTVPSSSWRIAPAYAGDGDWKNDLAVIDNVPLAAPNGQWFQFLNATPSDRMPIVVCGYSKASNAVPELTQAIDGDKQHLHGGYVTEQSNPEVIEYAILTLKGNSGSPVYHVSDRSGQLEALICAVHVTGEPAAKGLNRGCFITPAKIDWIEGRTTAFSLGSRALEIPLDPGEGGRSIGLDALQPADVIVSTTGQAVSYVIRAGTFSAVSHAMVYAGDGMVIEAVGGGVREIQLSQAIGDAILAVAYRDTRVNSTSARAIVEYARSRVGNPYNYAGAAFTGYRMLNPLPARIIDGIAGRFGLEPGQAGAVYCSELILEAFERAGIPLVASRPGTSTPDDLVQLSRSVLAYVGHLKGEDVPLGIPMSAGDYAPARRRAAGAMQAAAGRPNGKVLKPEPPPPRARAMVAADVAVAIGGFVLETVRDSSGDVTWELDQFTHIKHPNDTPPANPAPFRDAATIKIDKWPVSGGMADDISAWFSIDWQYNGLSLGNVRISNIGTNDAVGWSLHVRAQIMDDNIVYQPGGCAALRIRFHYRFSRGIGADNIAQTDVQLFGDGTYETKSNWVQSSALALAQSARFGSRPTTWALDGGASAAIEAAGIIIGAVTSSEGDVKWKLDAFRQIKHPNDVAPANPAPFRDAPPIKIEDWTMGLIDKIGADFVVNWQYNGTSLGNININNVYVNDAIGMGLEVEGTIEHDNAVYDHRAAMIHVRPDGVVLNLLNGDGTTAKPDMSRQKCAAMRVHFDFTWDQFVGPAHKAAVDLHLFGDGTYTRYGRWVQHSFL
jgi:V8-like Glu-specific endopeptidase/cell wall-associated NlpC family hydrolase